MKISLCMIVKNEEKNIRECLDRAIKIVDEVIVVDTGSDDKTREILKEFKNDKKIIFIDYKWEDDFSKARNKSIEKATGDWILILDADERIFCNRKKLEEVLKKEDNICYSIPIYNVFNKTNFTVSTTMIRLYKNNKPLYKGAIHEQIFIDGVQPRDMGIIDKDICKIYHYGYSDSVFEEKNKSKRNMDIIKMEIEKEPENPFHWYNKGVMEIIDENFENALNDFIKSHELCKGVRMMYHNQLLMGMVQSMFFLNQFKDTAKFIEDLLDDDIIKGIPDFSHYLGLSYMNLKKYDKAIKSFKRAISIGEYYGGISRYGMGSYLPMIGYAKTLELKGTTKQSIEKYRESIFNENNLDMLGLNDLKVLLRKENMHKELEELEKQVISFKNNNKSISPRIDKPELIKIKNEFKDNIQTLIEQGLIEEARNLINEYENIVKSDPSIYSMKGIMYIIEDDMHKAEEVLKLGLEKYQENFDILYNLGYLYQSLEKSDLAIYYYKKALRNTNNKEDIKEIHQVLNSLGVDETIESENMIDSEEMILEELDQALLNLKEVMNKNQ